MKRQNYPTSNGQNEMNTSARLSIFRKERACDVSVCFLQTFIRNIKTKIGGICVILHSVICNTKNHTAPYRGHFEKQVAFKLKTKHYGDSYYPFTICHCIGSHI